MEMKFPSKIEFMSPEDGLKYTVLAIPWVKKNEIRSRHTKIVDVMTQKVTFDDAGFSADFLKEAVLKDGKPLTEEDLAKLGPKTGDLVEQAVNALNFLSQDEIKNSLSQAR